MDDEFDEVIAEFLVESYDNLDRLDQDLLALEENPGEVALLASAFRTIHTIKGTCGFLGFGKLERVTHVGENLLSKLRDGALALDSEITTALLAMVDAVRAMLAAIESTGADGTELYEPLAATLTALSEGRSASTEPADERTRDVRRDVRPIRPQRPQPKSPSPRPRQCRPSLARTTLAPPMLRSPRRAGWRRCPGHPRRRSARGFRRNRT